MLGIIPGFYVEVVSIPLFFIVTVILLSALYFYKNRLFIAFPLISILFVLAGFLNSAIHKNKSHIPNDICGFAGTVDYVFDAGEKFTRYNLSVNSIVRDTLLSNCRPFTIDLFILNKDTFGLKKGLCLYVDKSISPYPEPINPGQFNYRRFKLLEGKSGQVFASGKDFIFIDSVQSGYLIKRLDKIRNSSNSIINKFIASVRERSVLKALLLGDKSELSEETKLQYSKAGAMHVLAVSGLHVGVTYLMLTFLLGYIPYLKSSKVIKGVLVISFLWFYAFFTGMSPSVVRAVSMFSLFAFAELINRKSAILNTVFFTAFVMLLFDPLLLFQVGFQLSFMAVLGIVIFNPIFAKFFTFNSKVLNYCWKIVSVSLAAQVTTLPIVLFYFHQFPVLFLITNLIILPVMPLIMVGGTILLFFGNTFLAVLTGKVLGWVLYFINETIKIISSFEFSVIDNIHFDLDKVIIFYLLLVLFSLWLWKRKFLYFKYLTMLLLACSIYSGYQLYLKKKQKWVLFSSSGSVKMGVFELYNSFILDTDTLSDYSIALWKDSEMFFGTNRRRYIDSRKIGKSSFICFYNGNLFGVITEDIDIPAGLDIKLDFIIVKDDIFINQWMEYSEVFIITNHSPQGLKKKPPDNISVYYQGASWLLLNNIISNN